MATTWYPQPITAQPAPTAQPATAWPDAWLTADDRKAWR